MVKTVPAYALYGEKIETEWGNFFNLERLPQRSSIYNWSIPPHVHKALMHLLFIYQGEAEILINSVKINVQAPGVLLVPAGTVHSQHYSTDVDGPSITASQRPVELVASSLMPDLVQMIRKPDFYHIPSQADADRIFRLYMDIERELQGHKQGAFTVCVSLFIALLVNILRCSRDKLVESAPLPVNTRKAAIVDKFLSLVSSKEKAHIPVELYADEIGVTPGHLSRLCREVLGISSLEVINARVIQDAQKELIYTSKSVKQLADALGFSDEAYFTRFFKKHIGLSPKNFREMAVKEVFQDYPDKLS